MIRSDLYLAKQRDIDAMKRIVAIPFSTRETGETAMKLTHQAKNLYNTTTFLIRQVFSAYDRDSGSDLSHLKTELHSHQTVALVAFNSIVASVNAARLKKVEGKLDSEGKQVEVKVLPLLTPVMEESPFAVLLDATVLDQVVKSHEDDQGALIYRRLPASSSQQVVQSVIDVWKAAFAAMESHRQDPTHFTGKPGLPSFIEKKGYFPLEVPYQMMASGGFPKPRVLQEFEGLSVAAQEEFYAFDVRSAIEASCLKRGWTDYVPKHVRVITKGSKVKLEAVVELKQTYPEGSFLSQLFDLHGEVLREHAKPKQRDNWMLDYLKGGAAGDVRVAGIDPGQNGLCTVAFTSGNQGLIHMGQRYERKLKSFDSRIDLRISGLTTDRIKELQGLKAEAQKQGVKLERALHMELKIALKALHADESLKKLRRAKENWKTDYEHKLSHDIVDHCARYGIDVIVIGQNKGMKNGQEHGAKGNRRAYNIAHARFTSLVKYKAAAHGIAVVTTEESYTSKSSFVDDDALPTYGDEKAVEASFSGTRPAKNRNWFIRQKGEGRTGPGKVHADINGAFNIIRKIFNSFRYSDRLSLKFKLRWISPRVGATGPMSCS